MPRLTAATPKLCRDHNTAIVYLDGQRIRLGRWGTPQAQEHFDRIVAEWLANKRRLPPPPEHRATVTEICVAYMRYANNRYGASDLDHIRAGLRAARRLYGSEAASSLGSKRLCVVREELLRQDLARRTINKRINWIRSAFKWAAAQELCDEEVCRRQALVKGLKRGEGGRERPKIKPVPRSHIRQVRRHMPRPVRAMTTLQLLTGSRSDKLVNLRAIDLDTSGSIWTCAPEAHKTAHHDKDLVIYFGPRAQRILTMFMTDRPVDQPMFSPREAVAEVRRRGAKGHRRPNQKPNPKRTGRTVAEQYVTGSYRRAIHRACDKAGVARWSPHRLRHNAGTFLRREFGIEMANTILGHSTISATLIYAEKNHKKAQEIMAKVG